MAYMFETIVCPFCGNGHAHITYEENRVYQLNCPDCHNAIFHQSGSWDGAVGFFKRMGISDDARIRELLEADDEGRLAIWPCKAGDTLFWAAHSLNKPIEVLVLSFRDYGHGNRWIHCVTRSFEMSSIGKELFLTREEAEAALEGGNHES